MDWARALVMARRRRGLNAGSGWPIFAATVISRASLEKILDRIASDLPLRCMIFLACEWPAIGHPELYDCGNRWGLICKHAPIVKHPGPDAAEKLGRKGAYADAPAIRGQLFGQNLGLFLAKATRD